MNYIGSKVSLLDFLDSCIQEVAGRNNNTLCDLFAGTGIVGRHYKQRGMSIISNDIQYYSYILNKHYIGNCSEIGLKNIFDYLNQIPNVHGFIYNNYSVIIFF